LQLQPYAVRGHLQQGCHCILRRPPCDDKAPQTVATSLFLLCEMCLFESVVGARVSVIRPGNDEGQLTKRHMGQGGRERLVNSLKLGEQLLLDHLPFASLVFCPLLTPGFIAVIGARGVGQVVPFDSCIGPRLLLFDLAIVHRFAHALPAAVPELEGQFPRVFEVVGRAHQARHVARREHRCDVLGHHAAPTAARERLELVRPRPILLQRAVTGGQARGPVTGALGRALGHRDTF